MQAAGLPAANGIARPHLEQQQASVSQQTAAWLPYFDNFLQLQHAWQRCDLMIWAKTFVMHADALLPPCAAAGVLKYLK